MNNLDVISLNIWQIIISLLNLVILFLLFIVCGILFVAAAAFSLFILLCLILAAAISRQSSRVKAIFFADTLPAKRKIEQIIVSITLALCSKHSLFISHHLYFVLLPANTLQSCICSHKHAQKKVVRSQ